MISFVVYLMFIHVYLIVCFLLVKEENTIKTSTSSRAQNHVSRQQRGKMITRLSAVKPNHGEKSVKVKHFLQGMYTCARVSKTCPSELNPI